MVQVAVAPTEERANLILENRDIRAMIAIQQSANVIACMAV
jgi:hypothetical protein